MKIAHTRMAMPNQADTLMTKIDIAIKPEGNNANKISKYFSRGLIC